MKINQNLLEFAICLIDSMTLQSLILELLDNLLNYILLWVLLKHEDENEIRIQKGAEFLDPLTNDQFPFGKCLNWNKDIFYLNYDKGVSKLRLLDTEFKPTWKLVVFGCLRGNRLNIIRKHLRTLFAVEDGDCWFSN